MAEDEKLTLRQQAWRAAYDAYGTAYIFEQRQRATRSRLRLINFVGLAVPLAVGASVLAFGFAAGTWNIVIWIAGVLGVGQVVVSLWALNARWEERLAYASESAPANHDLSQRFRNLAERAPAVAEFVPQLQTLLDENSQRTSADYKQDITEKEKRAGHRATLRHFQKACSACKNVPVDMHPTKCAVCGNF